MILAYNQFTDGVDESDKMLYSYLDERVVNFVKLNIFGLDSELIHNLSA